MEEKNELGDIILNKTTNKGGNKKVVLAAATLGIILIIVVLLMNSLSGEPKENLPQTALPPKPQKESTSSQAQKEEPLFEDVEVIDESTDNEEEKLDKIAQKLKEESVNKPIVKKIVHKTVTQPKPKQKPKPHPKPKQTKHKASPKGNYYIQVGSFTKYEPNKKFLHSITANGYTYHYHKVTINGRKMTKVLIGPFATQKEARSELQKIRKKIVKGAFLTKIKQ